MVELYIGTIILIILFICRDHNNGTEERDFQSFEAFTKSSNIYDRNSEGRIDFNYLKS